MFWASGSVRRFQHTKRILQKRSLPLSRTSTHPSISVSETQGVMFIARSHAFRRLAFQTPTSITSSSHRWQRMQSSVAQQRNETPDAQTTAAVVTALQDVLKPREVVNQLDKFIIGQQDAKRAVAIALRNRWRRQQMGEDLRKDVIPKNILMIGPTGCGKTEIARRIAKLSQAPFIKVEATKFTEVGFHGKDVDHIIRDLVEVSILMTKKRLKEKIKETIASTVEDRLIRTLVGSSADEKQIQAFRDMLRSGQMEDHIITVEVPVKPSKDETSELMKAMKSVASPGYKEKRTTVAEARTILEESETDQQLENLDVNKEAIATVEESGIVFIDEIDKLVSSDDYRSADASSEGVQRDLLPLIEGSTISTKYGNVNTDFILFIASGAFHAVKPSDLLAELQGRLPIRVTLQGLTEADLYRILTEPVNNLLYQQVEMLKSENVNLIFTDDAIREIAKVAHTTNKTVENIGARRLHTVIERVVEEVSFEASERGGETITIDAEYVQKRVAGLLTATDLRKYIL